MQQVNINTVFVERIVDSGHLKQLAVFIKLKALYVNGTIYNYSYRRISEVSGISINTLKQCIKFFKEMGWCVVHGKNLLFQKIFKVDTSDTKRCLVLELRKSENYRVLIKRLRILIIKACSKRFEHIKQVTQDYKDPKRGCLNAHKRAVRRVRECGLREISETVRFSISNFKVASLIGGKSKSTASRLISWGRDNQLLTKSVNIRSLDSESPGALMKFGNNCQRVIFSSKLNCCYVQYPNFIDFK